MISKQLSLNSISFYNSLISDYLNNGENSKDFYHLPPSKSDIIKHASNRPFDKKTREVLVEQLEKQYQSVELNQKVKQNIALLKNDNCFTITTGHQLNLAGGPLYTIYKILDVINACEEVNRGQINGGQTNITTVPIFWMATEDHDFEEINHCHVNRQTIDWDIPEIGNATGRINTEELWQTVQQKFRDALGNFPYVKDVIKTLEKAYTNNTLAKATFSLFNELFGQFGLIILDADNPALKQRFAPIVAKELTERKSKIAVDNQDEKLAELGFKTQAHARDINLFLLKNGKRERIKFENSQFTTDTLGAFSETELLTLLETNPEQFSPNVILRPVYQETILPNLAYFGGAGEISYWLQLKAVFNLYNIPFPVLMVRNSLLLVDVNIQKKIAQTGLSTEAFFEDEALLINNWTKANTTQQLELTEEKKLLETVFKNIITKAEAVDSTLEGNVLATMKALQKAIESLEKKMLKVEKQKNVVSINRIKQVKEAFYPNGVFQERYNNFFEYYSKYGPTFLNTIKQHIQPFEKGLTLVEL